MVKYSANVAAAQTASPSTTGNGTVLSFTAGSHGIVVSVSSAAVYMTFDGTVPSSTNGLTLPAGTVQFLPIAPSKVTVLAASGTPTVNIVPLF